MNKYMLETGMVIELRNNKKYMIIGNTGYNLDDFLPLDNYNDNLTSSIKDSKDWDIIKVYKNNMNSILEGFINDKISLIWERTDDKNQINWNIIPKNTKVLVRNNENEEWERRYFCRYKNGVCYVCIDGKTSWSGEYIAPYRYCILVEDDIITAEKLNEDFEEYCDEFGEICKGCKYEVDTNCEFKWLIDNYDLSKK